MNHDQYGLPDVRQLMAGRTQFLPAMSQTPVVESFPMSHHPSLGVVPLPTPYHYEPWGGSGSVLCATARGGSSLAGFNHHEPVGVSPSVPKTCGLELEGGFGNEIAGNGRWPRQETLTLLEIRSRLDFKFKEANQKGPLWDEVSRIMAEENGYMRSGKKCREKFENLYKYYKKTKEGKAGRQDGKHYRFFRQLEAIYGGSNNLINPATSVHEANLGGYNNNMSLVGNTTTTTLVDNNKASESMSFTNDYSSELEISSSEDANDDQDLSAIALMMSGGKSKEKRRSWKGKVKEFIDVSMRKVMETQEEWMERMVKAMEVKETERMCKEEEWRRQEAARLDRELEFWAKERAWLEARDAALMEALKKVSHGGGPNNSDDHGNVMSMFCNIMREKEDTRTYNYFQHLDLYNQDRQQQQQQQQQREGDASRLRRTSDEDQMASVQREGNGGMDVDSNSNNNAGFLHVNNEEMWWDKYGLKLSSDKYHRGN